MQSDDRQPVFLDLFRIRFPLSALVSIGHRVSGVMLFLSLPAALYLFGISLQSAAGFAQVREMLAQPEARLLLIPWAWFLTHHLLAGIRHLLLDMEIGVERGAAQRGSLLVIGGGLLALLLVMVGVW